MMPVPGQKVVVVSASGVSGWPRAVSPPVRLQSPPRQSQARYVSSRATSESAWGGARSRSSSPQAPVFIAHTHPGVCSTPCPVTAYAPNWCKGCSGGFTAVASPRVVVSPRGLPTRQPIQVPFQGRAVYASAAVPAARQHTLPSRVGRGPLANQKWHMASAPAMPLVQPRQEEVDSEYSPRDSVWKRYFCNGQKGATSPSSQKQAKVFGLHERSANVEKPVQVEEVKLRSPLQEENHGVALDDCAQSQLLDTNTPLDAKAEEVSLRTPLSQQSRVEVRPESATAAVPSRPPAQERSRQSQAPLQNTERLAACAENVSEEELLELSALTRPPPVRGIVESALMLLGFRDASWASARAAFEDPERFKEKLRSFNASKISRLQYQKLRRSLQATKGLEQSRNKCGSLEEWCCAVADVLSSRYSEAALAEAAAKRLAASNSGVSGTSAAPSKPEFEAYEYVLRPDLGDLVVTPDIYSMTPNELRHVRDLKVHRPRVGEVTFHGEIDLIAYPDILEDLPNLVRLEPGEVVLYPDSLRKPFEGQGLNRPATITLFGCLPPQLADFDEESKARYRHRIAEMTEQKGARFLDYDCDKGLWQFGVDHF
mmetsp:Transcript_13275/g.29263  ORF Transcript_13275/g.29263 Transcript_13275/m.29263 type:complete len:599 (+) Transcript_13275:70-1866(+)